MQPVLTVLKGSDARRRYKPPARPYHLFYYTGFVNTFTENGRTFYPYPPLRGASFYRKGLPSAARRGWLPFFWRQSRLLFTFPTRERRCVEKSGILVSQPSPLGKGDRAAVDRVLSHIVDLRRISSLSFIPLEPYPARSARHLPHAGKALSVVILHVSCIRFDDMGIAVSPYRSLPHWGRGTAPAVDRVLSQTAYLRRSSSLFSHRHPHPTSAPSGHLLP